MVYQNNSTKVKWAAHTDPGLVRSRNEDYYLARPDLGLFILCDGLGGHTRGETASKVCAQVISQTIEQGFEIKDAVNHAHKAVWELDMENSSPLTHPGTTVAVLLIEKKKWTIAWIGDTRVWIHEKYNVRQITKDHTVTRQLLDWGAITQKEAMVHPKRHSLTRAVGIQEKLPDVSIESGKLESGQIFIMGSDGMAFWDDPDKLSMIVADSRSFDDVVTSISRETLAMGGMDNFTVMVVGKQFKQWPIRKAFQKMAPFFF